MTRRSFSIILILVIASVSGYFYFREEPSSVKTKTLTEPPLPLQTKAMKIPLPVQDGRKILGVKPPENRPMKRIQVSNSISSDWEKKLKTSLLAQGGSAIKDINIKKVESLIWVQDQHALNVESVVIELKNDKDEESSFRAMIDSQTGKILETWDRPVTDPMNPKENTGLKLDPRYFND